MLLVRPFLCWVSGRGVDEGTAVAAHLALYRFSLKTSSGTSAFDPRLEKPQPPLVDIAPLAQDAAWETGVVYASAQNLARTVSVGFRHCGEGAHTSGCSLWSCLRT